MANSIFDQWLSLKDCKDYCKLEAEKLGLKIEDFFEDNINKLKFAGNSNIYNFAAFRDYSEKQLSFKLVNMSKVKETGLDEYVKEHKLLRFHLRLKGFSFCYSCSFSAQEREIKIQEQKDNAPDVSSKYRVEPSGQLAWRYLDDRREWFD